MFRSLINRIIFWELCKVFFMSLTGLTGLLLLAVVVIEAQNQGLGPMQILMIIPLMIPSTLPFTIPATTLFATCVVYGRLAHDNEILAIRAAGINIIHVVWPAAVLGLAMSVVTAGLFHTLIPRTYHMMKSVFLDDIENMLYTMLKREGRFAHPRTEYAMFVKRVEGRKLIKPLFLHREPHTQQFDIIAEAREAEINLELSKKRILVKMRDCNVADKKNEAPAHIDEKIWAIDIPDGGVDDRRYRRTDMTWDDLVDRLEELKVLIKETEHKIAHNTAMLTLANPPETLGKHVQNLRAEKKMYEQQTREFSAEIHRRPALALGCLCFVLVGCPVGIWFSRSDYLSAFVTCFLPIVLLYYPLMLCGENMARGGSANLAVAIWSADAIMFVIAIGLYRRLMKH